MPTIPADVLFEFSTLCNWTHYCWQLHRAIYHDSGREAELQGTTVGNGLGRLSIMTQEYCHLQLVKLHDPATSGSSRRNLGLDYIIVNGGWSPAVDAELRRLRGELDKLGKDVLAKARNKVICHNDVDTIMAKANLGSFPDGDEAKYFAALRAFVDLAWKETNGGSFRFDRVGASEGAAVIASIGRAAPLGPGGGSIPR
jgi:hypothetical protein